MAFFFELIGFIVILIFALVPGLIEKPCPKGYVHNDLKAAKDLASGISKWEYLRRKNRGDYWITNKEYMEQFTPKEVIPGVVDIDRYNYDKEKYGKLEHGDLILERRVKFGSYRHIVQDKSKWDLY